MEANNMKAMREALTEALNHVNDVYDTLSKSCVEIEKARQGCREARGVLIPALVAPPRNCDVGTAEEQCIRHAKWCESRADVCLVPKADKCKACFAKWAQMPYEEGGEK